MFVSLLLLLLITFSGTILTYFYEKDETLLRRLCAGNVTGTALFGLVAFLVACGFGLTATTVLLSLLITLLPLILLLQKAAREKFATTVRAAKENFEAAGAKKILGFAYYSAFFVLLYFFFERAMIEKPNGIFTGGSQNLGDLPFHLGAIFSFTEGQNLPPENPSYAFAKFTYPFMADFVTACFVSLGARVRDAMLMQNVFLGFSLIVLFENFTFQFMKNRLAARFAPVILLFSGGLGFVIFFRDYWQDGRGFFEFLWNLPEDYTIRAHGIRWGNSLTTLFMTQRSLLLGMPITLIVLTQLWKIFTTEAQRHRDARQEIEPQIDTNEHKFKKTLTTHHSSLTTIAVGLLAGTLPLIHIHSLAVLFVVCAFLFFFSLNKWLVWAVFALSVAVVAVPELLWVITGSATRLSEFVGWHFGWEAGQENIFVFWAKNLGIFIPLLIFAFWQFSQKFKGANKESELQTNADGRRLSRDSDPNAENQKRQLPITNYRLLIFYLPFLLIFITANLVKLAPWEWDNIKVLIYWFAASILFVAWFLAKIWEHGLIYKFVSLACLLMLSFSGALDVWRVVSKQINYKVFDRDAVAIAEQIKQKTAPNGLFLNAPTYNSAVVLAGRRSLMRYSGHLSSYGIDYLPRQTEVKRIYEGTALADNLLKKNDIQYVLISPEETSNLTVNEKFFSKYPVVAEAGAYRVYHVKK